MVFIVTYANKPLNNIRIVTDCKFKNSSIGHFKFFCPIKKPFIFLSDIFQVSLRYRVNVSRKTVSRNYVLNTVGQLIYLNPNMVFGLSWHVPNIRKFVVEILFF